MLCEHKDANCRGEVRSEGCRTQYADQSMNKDPHLCRAHASEYHDYWDAMWEELYADQLAGCMDAIGKMNIYKDYL